MNQKQATELFWNKSVIHRGPDLMVSGSVSGCKVNHLWKRVYWCLISATQYQGRGEDNKRKSGVENSISSLLEGNQQSGVANKKSRIIGQLKGRVENLCQETILAIWKEISHVRGVTNKKLGLQVGSFQLKEKLIIDTQLPNVNFLKSSY